MNTARDPVPLTSDVVFKYVFGNTGSENILRAFLSAVQTDAGFPAVAEVRIENPFNIQDFSDDKLSVVDVRAIDVNGVAYTIELPKTGKPSTSLDRWSYYLKQRGSKNAMDDLILLKTMRDDPEIEDAEARYREFLANPELEERYLARQKFLRDQATYRKEAREEGRQEGRREEAVQIARRMLTRGMDESIVADVTGLTVEEIRGL